MSARRAMETKQERRRRIFTWVARFVGLAVIVGALAGVLWSRITPLATYQVGADSSATITERQLVEISAGDSYFVVIGFVIGIGLGVIAWRWLGRIGWPIVVVTVLTLLVAGVVCYIVGGLLGPGDFDTRLAAAKPGDLVPVALSVRAEAAFLAWPFGAIIPLLLAASLARDPEEPRSILPRRADPSHRS